MSTAEKIEIQNPHGQKALRQLMLVWLDFERKLQSIPILARLEKGTFTRDDYKRLLCNLRAQVVEGARWITRAASSFDRNHLEMRSTVIQHAQDEHRDYELLEKDYQSIGGSLDEIQQTPRNIGTEALNGYLMHQASQANPVQLLGAMFIIEGLGEKMATRWADKICSGLRLEKENTQFLRYHGANDESHFERLYDMLDTDHVNEETAAEIVKTAKVVARLYGLQLEELDNV